MAPLKSGHDCKALTMNLAEGILRPESLGTVKSAVVSGAYEKTAGEHMPPHNSRPGSARASRGNRSAKRRCGPTKASTRKEVEHKLPRRHRETIIERR